MSTCVATVTATAMKRGVATCDSGDGIPAGVHLYKYPHTDTGSTAGLVIYAQAYHLTASRMPL